MEVLYCTSKNTYNVTKFVMKNLLFSNKIIIPSDDDIRNRIFCVDENEKDSTNYIKIIDKYKNGKIFLDGEFAKIDINIDLMTYQNINFEEELKKIQNKITLKYGSMYEEYPEQLMTLKFLNPSSKVLELGGNIGRNSAIISHVLSDGSNHVVLECDTDTVMKLEENKILNNFKFQIEKCALSKRPIYIILDASGNKTWQTRDIPPRKLGWIQAKTISYNEIMEKYQIQFDTLICDCEGALYNILQDDVAILNDIKMIIIENDFTQRNHKTYVDECFTKYNFIRVYKEGHPYTKRINNFYEVWVNIIS